VKIEDSSGQPAFLCDRCRITERANSYVALELWDLRDDMGMNRHYCENCDVRRWRVPYPQPPGPQPSGHVFIGLGGRTYAPMPPEEAERIERRQERSRKAFHALLDADLQAFLGKKP
jgi:hypothetical protein